jgi:hypothetical protein
MRPIHPGIATVLVMAAFTPLHAQTGPDALTPGQIALACAPAPAAEPPAEAPRLLGAQDTLLHTLLAPQDLLVVGGGTQAGLQLGQQFFIRRPPSAYTGRPGGAYMGRASGPTASTTAGWLRIVALNETTAIGTVEHVCGAIFRGDVLVPFEAPSVAADSDDDAAGELDFTSLARVLAAPENHVSAAPGEYVVIDRGRDHGIEAGARLAIYRDLRAPGMPLAALGEAIVMSSGTSAAVIRITRARDAVLTGDYLVGRKQPPK